MIRLTFFLIFFVSLLTNVMAAEPRVALSQMGNYELTFDSVQRAEQVPAPLTSATVSYSPGDAFKITAPLAPQQIDMLVGNGESVEAGQPIAKIAGSEVHHFVEQLQAQTALFEQASLRYQQAQKLFNQQAISQESWQQIIDNYYFQKLALGHLSHFADLTLPTDDEDTLLVTAPINGFVLFQPLGTDPEQSILTAILPHSALRLTFSLPAQYSQQALSVNLPGCTLEVAWQRYSASGLTTQIWTTPIPSDCDLKLGQTLSISPQTSTTALTLPRSSVFTLEGATCIALKSGTELVIHPIEILGNLNEQQLLVSPTEALNNAEVLSRSVSALQGILTGMGGRMK